MNSAPQDFCGAEYLYLNRGLCFNVMRMVRIRLLFVDSAGGGPQVSEAIRFVKPRILGFIDFPLETDERLPEEGTEEAATAENERRRWNGMTAG